MVAFAREDKGYTTRHQKVSEPGTWPRPRPNRGPHMEPSVGLGGACQPGYPPLIEHASENINLMISIPSRQNMSQMLVKFV